VPICACNIVLGMTQAIRNDRTTTTARKILTYALIALVITAAIAAAGFALYVGYAALAQRFTAQPEAQADYTVALTAPLATLL
jgi:hypothetical protein